MSTSLSRPAASLDGLKVFIVEDETLVAMQLEDMLLDLGCEITGMAMRVGRALEALAAGPATDVAVLDVNIAGETVYPVAAALRDRAIPIVFATGYGRGGLLAEWHDCPVLQKPYTEREIAEALREALSANETYPTA